MPFLKAALDKGEKVYNAKDDQDDTKLATKGTEYTYATKIYDEKGKVVSAKDIVNTLQADGKTTSTKYFADEAGTIELTTGKAKDYTDSFSVNGKLSFNLHVGADSSSDNKIIVDIDAMSAAGIGIKGLHVDTEETATAAIDRISEAISKVSSQRSSLGAVQNRLEHTINNLDNVSENTTSAESRIRDTDMAKEMVNYSKNNILAQAGQSMLAQANQSNQGVLSLLQ